MGCVYVAPYTVAHPDDMRRSTRATAVASEFTGAVQRAEWPYDIGDDPSFFCGRRFSSQGGAVTWGVCRQDVRCQLARGDVVVFIGFEKHATGITYDFAGYATVARCVTQAEIWQSGPSLQVYRAYLNVLVRPDAQGLTHHEVHPGGAHRDWLWRLTCRRGQHWEKRDFDAFDDPECQRAVHPGVDRTAAGAVITLAPNYIIFASGYPETFIVADPPRVAWHERAWGAAATEQWRETDQARAVRMLTLDRRPGRALKSRGRQRHRHVRLEIDPSIWRDEARDALEAVGLRPRDEPARSGP